MCGIAGRLDPRRRLGEVELRTVLEAMTATIHHRGPDDGGVEVDAAGGVALGARRLAIVDLSEAGHQPMASPDGRHLLVYNGELYNADELRGDLRAAGWSFRGHSDTEVLLGAIATWGAREAAERAVGMFAFGAWDGHARRLVLGRDRFGEKPLYYGWQDGVLRFGSELRVLLADPAFQPAIDRDALVLLMRHTYIPAPHSVYESVRKLPPASLLTWTPEAGERVEPYWSVTEVARASQRHPYASAEEVDAELAPVLRETVRRRLVADVPLGAFLSGGIDSSLVVALMQEHHAGPVKTFTIGFPDERFDEAPFAREVARVLGTDHTEQEVTPEEALAVIPGLPEIYDEPFADQSQIPTFLLAALARRDVTVALSGDGGDELFGGYWHHLRGIDAQPGDRVPGPLRAPLGRLLARFAAPAPRRRHLDGLASWADPTAVIRGGSWPASAFTEWERRTPFADPLDAMMALDTATFLPDDVLVKMDRATMAVSLEGRAPYLDPEVAAVAWRIPPEQRMGESGGKQPLRRLLRRYVPEELFERPKMGFNVPIDAWLRGPLRPWGEDLLSSVDDDLLDRTLVRAEWDRHQAGEDHAYRLWPVLVLQSWLLSRSGPGHVS